MKNPDLDLALNPSPAFSFFISRFKKENVQLLALSLFCCILWHLPIPTGLTPQAWHLFSIFVTLIIGAIIKPIPMGALAIISIAACTCTKTLDIKQALSGFGSETIWLVVMAFLFSRGFIKTGLGLRIAYYFVKKAGQTSLRLGYCLALTECCLAPLIPSNSARGGAIIYPIALSLSHYYNSYPKPDSRRQIGAYLMKVCFQVNLITSAMFMTGMAANALIVDLLQDLKITISWSLWASAALVPGVASLIIIPYLIYTIFPPDIKQTPQAPKIAREKLQALGKMNSSEMIMMGTFGLVLCLWILSSYLNLHPTIAGFLGISILLVSHVLSFEDILKEKNAWSTFIWLAVILTLSKHLATFGLIDWFTQCVRAQLNYTYWPIALSLCTLVYFYSHYLFGSLTAHITAMYSAFLMILLSVGTPPLLAALLLAFSSNLCGAMTHYGSGTAPIYFETQYLTMSQWWRIGAIVSFVNVIIWSTLGSFWWHYLGLW